jgi:hypothetical protein
VTGPETDQAPAPDPLAAGWFVAAGGRPSAGAGPAGASARKGPLAAVVTGCLVALGGICCLLVPIAVVDGSVTTSCGMPILGRYDAGSPPDLAATAFTACWNQAQVRRPLGLALLLVGLALVVGAALLAGPVATRRTRATHRGGRSTGAGDDLWA